MITQSPTFCPCPWTTVNIDQSGVVKPCLSSHELGHNLGNINQTSIQTIIHGPRWQLLRNTISAGKWDPVCGGCERLEQQGCSSPRQSTRVAPEVLEAIDLDINYYVLTDITVNWSNLCNLTCTYCSAVNSTAWQAVKNIPIALVQNQHVDLIELACKHSSTIKGLSLGGGEPLLQKGLPQFLQHIKPEQTSVMITTNLTVDLENNSVYRILSTWPNVSWLISFDNANQEQFEYVRNPANWNQFYNNIKQLKLTGQRVVAHPAYSIYCALHLTEYYKFCIANDLEIFWCDLRHPYALDIRRAPEALRKAAQAEIDRVVKLYTNHPGNLSLDTLNNYRLQLDTQEIGPVPDGNILDPVEWHKKQETILKQRNRFVDLWSEYSS